MKSFSSIFPWLVVGAAGLCFVVMLFPADSGSTEGMDIHEFGDIPVLVDGRYKPLDSYARSMLLSLAHKQSVYLPDKKTTISATHWLLNLMAFGLIDHYSVITITHPEVLAFLDLPERRSGRYHIEEVRAKLMEKPDRIKRLEKAVVLWRDNPKQVSALDAALVQVGFDLTDRLSKISKMKSGLAKKEWNADAVPCFRIENLEVLNMLELHARFGLRYSKNEIVFDKPAAFDQFQTAAKPLIEAEQRKEKPGDLVSAKILELAHNLYNYEVAARLADSALLVPGRYNNWKPLGTALATMETTGQDIPEATALVKIIEAYAVNNAPAFNKEVANYRTMVVERYPTETRKCSLELFYNDFEAMYLCTLCYVGVFLLSCLSWFGWSKPLQQAAFRLTILVLVVHTFALCLRMYLMGRPPVTNLYASAVFIGWGCVVLCVGLERLFHGGFGIMVASVLGSLTLLLAMHLDAADTLEVLQPVLNTNFWLATHVVCVTKGYTATLVAGFLGMLYIVRGVFTPLQTKEERKNLVNMIYGVVCFATLLSFVGTVLGGIWADQSWGRFWGWDPKENGAVLIVIWNALILHARWGGMIKERGMAVLPVVGNMITGWSVGWHQPARRGTARLRF